MFNNVESSIGFYRYTDQRAAAAGDFWGIGQNNWGRSNSFNIGTPVKASCLSIGDGGNVAIPYNLIVNGDITT
jgi:hypothetical protein